ncbi:MAG: TylF/MycF family methyltransferase [Patescibacteria group bacterium]|nr:TylF/MycF family methyltransferase [Patescibacteria group bacterium]
MEQTKKTFSIRALLKGLIERNRMVHQLSLKVRLVQKALLRYHFSIEKLRLFLQVFPYTMIGFERLFNVYDLSEKVEEEKLEGAFVECGVWKGGAVAVMAYVTEKAGSKRHTWLFDSFEGLPEPTIKDGERAQTYSAGNKSGTLVSVGRCVGPLEYAQELFFDVLHLPKESIHMEKGWFQDTLQKAKSRVGSIAILRMDADWYESTKCILENLYDNVVPKGYIIIDDYNHWEGCKKAVDEFLLKRDLRPVLVNIDSNAIYFQKP